jgi:regulator of PEP synthase PpsR (kinase-PPPase family)
MLATPHRAFVGGLVTRVERIMEVRRNRVHPLADTDLDDYLDRTQIAAECSDAF